MSVCPPDELCYHKTPSGLVTTVVDILGATTAAASWESPWRSKTSLSFAALQITTRTATMERISGLEPLTTSLCEAFLLGSTRTCVSNYPSARSDQNMQACNTRCGLVISSTSSDNGTAGRVNGRPNFQNLRMEKLKDEDLEEWLPRPDPVPPGNAGALEAHVRVLVCHETENQTHTAGVASQKCYHVAKSSFDAIEEHLRLPVQTLPTMGSMWGVQSSEFITDTNAAGKETMCLGEYITGGPNIIDTCWPPIHSVLCSSTDDFVLGGRQTSQ